MNEDKHLLSQLCRNHPDALHRLYEKYKDDLFALALAVGGDRNLAEDALQDVFVTLARQAAGLGVRKNLKGYLASMIVNQIRNYLRNKKTARDVLQKLESQVSPQTESQNGRISSEDYETIHGALRKLPPEQSEVIWLHLHAGLSFRLIAENHNLPIATVHSRYMYGLQKMRTLLDGQLEINS
jgi:RNA polymerase sigma-70 factor (ECF subfamily)